MNKIFTLCCPKAEDKHYFSCKKHQYKNNLTVLVNDDVLFENINDAEENLPIILQDQIPFDSYNINTVSLLYDISLGDVKEKTEVTFVFDGNSSICTTNFFRKNFVQGSDKLTDQYCIRLCVNGQQHLLDRSFHQGDIKQVSVQNFVDMDMPISVELESKKQFTDSMDITFDQLEFKIQ
jgi:hypothetical protein